MGTSSTATPAYAPKLSGGVVTMPSASTSHCCNQSAHPGELVLVRWSPKDPGRAIAPASAADGITYTRSGDWPARRSNWHSCHKLEMSSSFTKRMAHRNYGGVC